MFGDTNHTPYQDLLPQYAAGTLDEIMARHVAAHLEGCDACRANLAEWRAIAGAMRRELAEMPPDGAPLTGWDALHARLTPHAAFIEQRSHSVSDNIGSSFDHSVMASPTPAPRPASRRWVGVASVAAVVLMIAASFAVFGTLRHANRGQPPVAIDPGCVNVKSSGDTLPSHTQLLKMSFTSPSNGWAVGFQFDSEHPTPLSGVIYHLHNCQWQKFPITLPKIALETVSMVSPDEGWAAGGLTKSGAWDINDEAALVVYHYQHGQWQHVNVPGTQAFVNGYIAMRNADEGWLLGQGPGNQPNGLFHYLNGTWSPVTLPANIAGGVQLPLVPVGPNDLWLSAYTSYKPDGTFTVSIVHDDAGHVTTYALPANTGVSGLSFPASNDGWMIGVSGNPLSTSQPQRPVLYHFDGTQFTRVPIPSFEPIPGLDSYFTDISLVSSQEGFIFGYHLDDIDPISTLILYHLHNGSWETYKMPVNHVLDHAGSNGIAMVSAHEGWAFARVPAYVGEYYRPSTVILHYTNGTWSVFEH